MKKAMIPLFAIAVVVIGSGFSQPRSSTEREITQLILSDAEYANRNNQDRPGSISKEGSLEFWSSGGLLHEVPADEDPRPQDDINIQPKHIRVATLVEGRAAVAQYYSEGSLKPSGFPGVSHYLTRVTAVYVKEGGGWKVRAAHYSPITGGSGTSQSVAADED